MHDTTIGWRFVNKLMKAQYGVDSMPETAENVAEDFNISREDQDLFALRSQQRAGAAMANGRLAKEIVPVVIPQRKGDPIVVSEDEHPRTSTTLADLQKLKTFVKADGTVTAGNASGGSMTVRQRSYLRRNRLRKSTGSHRLPKCLAGQPPVSRRGSWALAPRLRRKS